MLKQTIVADTIANEMLAELSDAEQEASNGGIAIMPSSETPLSIPPFPSISLDIYGPPNVSCPACSSGMNPNYNNDPTPTPLYTNV
jgi:hypothetical protein